MDLAKGEDGHADGPQAECADALLGFRQEERVSQRVLEVAPRNPDEFQQAFLERFAVVGRVERGKIESARLKHALGEPADIALFIVPDIFEDVGHLQALAKRHGQRAQCRPTPGDGLGVRAEQLGQHFADDAGECLREGSPEAHRLASRAHARARWAADWLGSSARPGFLFLHFYDAHSDTDVLPYESAETFRTRFAPGADVGFAEWTGPGGASESLRKVNEEGLELPDSLRARIPRLYDASVAEVDAAVGGLLDALRASGRYDDALIVVIADHGEALGEAGHFMHERLLEETLHIPLLIKFPQGQATARAEIVETVDILATILAALGLDPPKTHQGFDLSGELPRNFAFHRSGPDYAITTEDGWRLLYRWDPEHGVLPSALRRAGEEPGDGADLLAERPEVFESWEEKIAQLHRANDLLRARYRGEEVRVGASDQELLRSLGYID